MTYRRRKVNDIAVGEVADMVGSIITVFRCKESQVCARTFWDQGSAHGSDACILGDAAFLQGPVWLQRATFVDGNLPGIREALQPELARLANLVGNLDRQPGVHRYSAEELTLSVYSEAPNCTIAELLCGCCRLSTWSLG